MSGTQKEEKRQQQRQYSGEYMYMQLLLFLRQKNEKQKIFWGK